MIKLDSLGVKYDDKSILKNISLEIENHLSILGANGSGKSTLAKALCNLIDYDGSVSVDGEDIQELSRLQRAKLISYIPAKLEVYDPYISVEEFVLLSRFAHKKNFLDYSGKDKKITQNTLEFLKISHLKEHTISSLSSGEAQLTLIAGALAQQSKIIILDEPTANLDPHNSKIIAQHIKGLKDYHQVILITHDLHLASFIDSPIAFINSEARFPGKLRMTEDEAKMRTPSFRAPTRNLVYYKDPIKFFQDNILKELYGVEFSDLAVKYE